MFERRLKIFLLIMFVITGVLLARAMQLQVFGRSFWRGRATELMKRSEMIETTRGRILDVHGRVIAVDRPCIDACVDYRAIVRAPDERWIKKIAQRRLSDRGDSEYRRATAERRKQMLDAEIEQVKTDMQIMWAQLAKLSNKSSDEIDQIRQSIARKVEMRRRYVWWQRFEQARRGQEGKPPSPWYQRWLSDDSLEAPELDQFDVQVAEQTDAHVILRAISPNVNNELGKNLSRWPWLELRPSTHRWYPYAQTACHLLGNLSRVNREDLQNDPHAGIDELRQYFPNDLIGRSGLEAMLEPLLRGSRGRVERYVGGEDDRVVEAREPLPGTDVRTTIDIELQADVEELFNHVVLEPNTHEWRDELSMPGAAVIIDVATGDVRALASHPGFNLNEFDDIYDKLVRDDLERPLMNRATQFQLEPGSTVKPIVGLGAVTQGLITPDSTIECTGFLVMGGRRYSYGRCWVASNFSEVLGGHVAHHPIPSSAPHPTGYLTFAEALQRSCNIYFENVADKLGIEGLSYWFDRFGLGRPTGIGISEVSGRLPNDAPIIANRQSATWFAGIGQDQVLATPIQMANVAATIARGGVWMRPRLASANVRLKQPKQPKTATTREESEGPDNVDLKLAPAGLAAARTGMISVVNSVAGTGQQAKHEDVLVAGKTGSAQASPLKRPQRDELGRIVRDDKGRITWTRVEPIGTHESPNSEVAWYRGTPGKQDKIAHAWFIGFAPADDPKIAFAVLVEYGGSGGAAAGALSGKLLDACILHGYLARTPQVTSAAGPENR